MDHLADVEERFADYQPQNFNPDLSQWRGGAQIDVRCTSALQGLHVHARTRAHAE